ncbi:MAG: hypothetical protein IPH45_20460 [Bacteroidales bacterium]|nr:hypothetical protein [Bacteroidales bacterium]
MDVELPEILQGEQTDTQDKKDSPPDTTIQPCNLRSQALFKLDKLNFNLRYAFFGCPVKSGFSFPMFSHLFRRAMVNGFLKEAIMYSGLICTYIIIFLIGTTHHSS